MTYRLYYEPGCEASIILGRVSDEYCAEREDYRTKQSDSLGHIGDDALAQYDQLVGELIRKAGRLVVGEGTSSIVTIQAMAELKSRIDDQSGNADGILTESIAHHILEQTYTTACTMEERILDLVLLVAEVNTSKRARRFLERVSRCYLFGFDSECVVMCRAVLDAEFQARIPADDCIDVLGQRPARNGRPMFDLADRIAVAFKRGVITSDGESGARRVKKAGNDVVHRSPTPTDDTLGILTSTIEVLCELDV